MEEREERKKFSFFAKKFFPVLELKYLKMHAIASN